jgi:mevalonate kinase
MDNFNSKILLFGEYSIIKGSHGLAIPYRKYFGKLKISNEAHAQHKNISLKELCNYVANSSILAKNIDVAQFTNEVEQGLYFDSNIPQGYGVGSSGALCASILDRYGKNIHRHEQYGPDELNFIQDLMALMESFYHGTSSGLDPLISFVNRPVYIQGRNELGIVDIPNFAEIGNFYLVDTGNARKTGPLVHDFMKMCSNESFADKVEGLIHYTNMGIEALMNKNADQLEKALYEISRFQYLYMEKMIPSQYRDLWLAGLESKKYFMKLCGAGGGGFLMVYSPSVNISFLADYSVQKIN